MPVAHATPLMKQYSRYGRQPRARNARLGAKVSRCLSRPPVVPFDDIRAVARPALRHRLLLNFEGEAEQVDPDVLVRELLSTVVP